MENNDWNAFQIYILQLEQEGLVSRTFRRLDPDRQQTVVQAILDEATEKGPAYLNIKEVARRAGISIGSLYTYFPDRDGMLAFAAELSVRFVRDVFRQFRPSLAELPLNEAMKNYLAGGIEWSQAQAGFLRLFARAAYQGDPELAERLVRPIAMEMLEVIRAILAAADARGELRKGVDLEATARLVHALTIVAGDSQLLPYLNNYFQVVGDNHSPEQAMNGLLELIWRGIGDDL